MPRASEATVLAATPALRNSNYREDVRKQMAATRPSPALKTR